MKKITENQENFIAQIILSNTQGSSFQRAYVYKEDIDKQEFVKAFRNKLESLKETYRKEVSEEDHIKNIEKFREELSQKFPDILKGGKMRFGIAQKAVNLYLKFLWCLEYINKPPHCPIDRTVLTKVGYDIKWTELDDMKKYKEIIKSIKVKAEEKNQSIAEWELDLWQNHH
ncbi:hypothetical protein JW935_06195 [candidate division KSB1 bacterium]|nr:hypothetical protein [candidate division KSB1 bacterium]